MENLTKEKVIEILRNEYPYLNRKYNLNKLGLFGSFSKEVNTEKSDIDLLVDFSAPIGLDFIEMGEYLEEKLNRKVDLVTVQGYQNSNLNIDLDKNVIYVN